MRGGEYGASRFRNEVRPWGGTQENQSTQQIGFFLSTGRKYNPMMGFQEERGGVAEATEGRTARGYQ